MKRVARYSIELVKESNSTYNCETVINQPYLCAKFFKEVFQLDKCCEEKMVMACMDAKCKVIGAFEISSGTLTGSLLHPREIFKRAMLLNAHSIILAHNHPSSGEPDASTEDIEVTKRIKKAGDILGITLLDHIIVGDNEKYVSLKANGQC